MNEIEKIQELGEKLYQTRKTIKEVEEEAKQTKDELKILKHEVETELLELMTRAKIGSIKTEGGESYSKSTRNGVAIKDPMRALFWARDNACYSIDKLLLTQKLKGVEELPECFTRTITEFISVRKPAVKKED